MAGFSGFKAEMPSSSVLMGYLAIKGAFRFIVTNPFNWVRRVGSIPWP